ncbi:MAG TPA: ABC transporter ATP-binding protein [Candidatus Omnitrophica bacterium]|nr:MAG: ABC transporter ATP-binding protein [Omnitrophica WOR_2 bacterium GWA2_63_20]OGX16652.1 MAG: ABC transporter ATP-binding protein [Omnitrophica WOR_2 bacterium GWF2_63_9]OGX32281.1 MAG: ABC transporter ATP-binding protein [Omnitrophica WOR_2 bacterium RIFCSPHIGHO2_12_FULL_64_13]OGX35393.1 MAG: ABC transporter ATP-binding protein [Omnitrophica WOR_2 bacterium RIFCSPHIGHO2_02_FULL_63_39]OGX45439.1 MAG: ABC transporter ATP-binding protein [Omnitrophica WOR_2 bacterium RIFCSPLOWO2_02_FULL_63
MIEIRDLTKTFEEHLVLNGVNLTINKGETMVIIGRSGCGKSVLLKHLIGLMKPDRGEVRIDGLDVTGLSGAELDAVRLKMGMLFQGAALFDSMTVEDNVGFALREHARMEQPAIAQRVTECLSLVGLSGVGDLRPSELSGGMRKRVGLARAIANNPELILYDEPTTGIDPIMGDIINDLIIALRDRLKMTSVVVTHDMRSAYKVADRMAMLYNGTIIEVGTPEQIRQSSNPVVQQFIKGEAAGPIQEGMPDRRILSQWRWRPKPTITRGSA